MGLVISSDDVKVGTEVHKLDGQRHVQFDGSERWKVTEAKVDGEWLKVTPSDRAVRMREWAGEWLTAQSQRR
jgi:hypothetical protein